MEKGSGLETTVAVLSLQEGESDGAQSEKKASLTERLVSGIMGNPR